MEVARGKGSLALPYAVVAAAASSCTPEDAAGPGLNVGVSSRGSCPAMAGVPVEIVGCCPLGLIDLAHMCSYLIMTRLTSDRQHAGSVRKETICYYAYHYCGSFPVRQTGIDRCVRGAIRLTGGTG